MKKKAKKIETLDLTVFPSNAICIRYEIPDLLEAVCQHPACPEWLKHGLWDVFSNRNTKMIYSRHHWAAVLEENPTDSSERIEQGGLQ